MQEVIAHLFGISQPQANFTIQQLSAVINKALDAKGHKPARLMRRCWTGWKRNFHKPSALTGRKGPSITLLIRWDREYTTAENKCHTLKNNLVGGLEDRQIKYFGATHEGMKYDKKIADEEGTRFPDDIDLYSDTCFQGQELPKVTVHQPKKKPRNCKFSDEDKEGNRLISSIRVVIERIISRIKRCLVVKDVCSGTPRRTRCCHHGTGLGLHNYRIYYRNQSY